MNPGDIAIKVADAVLAELAEGVADGVSFSEIFTPTRTYDTELCLEDNAGLAVDVLFGEPALERDTRAAWLVVVPIDIAIRKQCGEGATDDADDLVTLAGSIWAFFAGTAGTPRVLTDYTEAAMREPSETSFTPYVPDILREKNQFLAIVRLEYEVSAA